MNYMLHYISFISGNELHVALYRSRVSTEFKPNCKELSFYFFTVLLFTKNGIPLLTR